MNFPNLSNVLVTQESLRNAAQVKKMIAHVQAGGRFNEEILRDFAVVQNIRQSGLIKITEFEDGAHYLQDGHHRSISIFLGGRDFLYDDEYIIEHWSYANYGGIGWKNKWITPYDVVTEVRLANIKPFRDSVFEIYDKSGIISAECFIQAHPYLYKTKRTIHTLGELAINYNEHNQSVLSSSTT